MKNETKLLNSYLKQKQIYETAKDLRVANRNKQISEINEKILKLQQQRQLLIDSNDREKEFETFESFKQKVETQVRQSTQSKAQTLNNDN